MPRTGFLRRQAENCIRLAATCPDAATAEYLRLMAAAFFKRALEDENDWLQISDDHRGDGNFPRIEAP